MRPELKALNEAYRKLEDFMRATAPPDVAVRIAARYFAAISVSNGIELETYLRAARYEWEECVRLQGNAQA